jgi:hypothetical protein
LIRKVWVCAALSVLITFPAPAAELKDLYPDAPGPAAPTPAREAVGRAFDNLFGLSSMMSIVHLRTGADGQTTRSQFRVLRRQMDGSRRILTESLAPAEIEGTRVLQIDRPDGSQENFAFVRTLNREPFRTQYRMADPFLCTWYEGITGPGQMALRAQSEYEVLSRRMDEVDGEPVYRVLIRPMASRGFDRVELAIAVRDFAILEYRNFLEPKDTEPTLVARTARVAMIAMDGHLLPTRMRYEDRANESRIDVEVTHTPLPPEMPAAMFEPRSFHRVRIDGSIEAEEESTEPTEQGQSPKP